MKALLKFDVPEERKQFMAAVKADDMAIVLWNIVYNFKKDAEREFDDDKEHSCYEIIDYVFDNILKELEQHGINVDDLMK